MTMLWIMVTIPRNMATIPSSWNDHGLVFRHDQGMVIMFLQPGPFLITIFATSLFFGTYHIWCSQSHAKEWKLFCAQKPIVQLRKTTLIRAGISTYSVVALINSENYKVSEIALISGDLLRECSSAHFFWSFKIIFASALKHLALFIDVFFLNVLYMSFGLKHVCLYQGCCSFKTGRPKNFTQPFVCSWKRLILNCSGQIFIYFCKNV